MISALIGRRYMLGFVIRKGDDAMIIKPIVTKCCRWKPIPVGVIR
jgi:hypothetical protein